ncbi:MAG TPA: lysophospholipid acyltransferase family protein [Thermoanaerobaculia bacterium]|nr:lysophospholipid acyltransferase family protein [Thermoanaerobaculia bacterium]
MLRTLWATLVAVAATVPLASATIVVASLRGNSPAIERIIQLWARLILWAAGIELRTENTAVLDLSQRYIIVANHYSYFDIPCIFAAIPQPIRFMAKASLFRIPIFGWAIGRAGFIPIDRKNRRTAVKSFDLAAERIRKGNTIVVFPEEGRSRDGRMRPFQRGGFLLALKTELPVVPVAIKGTWEVFRPGATRVTPGPVTITVTPPIPTAGLTLRDKEGLAEEARMRIATIVFGDDAGGLTPPSPEPSEPEEAPPGEPSADRS